MHCCVSLMLTSGCPGRGNGPTRHQSQVRLREIQSLYNENHFQAAVSSSRVTVWNRSIDTFRFEPPEVVWLTSSNTHQSETLSKIQAGHRTLRAKRYALPRIKSSRRSDVVRSLNLINCPHSNQVRRARRIIQIILLQHRLSNIRHSRSILHRV